LNRVIYGVAEEPLLRDEIPKSNGWFYL